MDIDGEGKLIDDLLKGGIKQCARNPFLACVKRIDYLTRIGTRARVNMRGLQTSGGGTQDINVYVDHSVFLAQECRTHLTGTIQRIKSYSDHLVFQLIAYGRLRHGCILLIIVPGAKYNDGNRHYTHGDRASPLPRCFSISF